MLSLSTSCSISREAFAHRGTALSAAATLPGRAGRLTSGAPCQLGQSCRTKPDQYIGGHSMTRTVAVVTVLTSALFAVLVDAQAPATPARKPVTGSWRNVGASPCVGPEGGTLQCASASTGVIAVRGGRLFDSASGRMLT